MREWIVGPGCLPLWLAGAWKLLTLSGTGLICYTNATQPMPLYAHVLLGIFAFCWFMMFVCITLGDEK